MEFVAILHKDPDSDYGVSFPDVPGCFSAGCTIDEAREMAAEALELHFSVMREEDEPIPTPRLLAEILPELEDRDVLTILVPAPKV